MTRTGKIARLPHDIREQLNARLRSGEQGKTLLQWLNALPEAIAILAANFTGHPFTPANLTEWKRGGYQDWLVRQDALDLARSLQDPHALDDGLLAGSFSEKLAHWLALQYAAAAQRLVHTQGDQNAKWSRLRELCADVSRLRRADLHAQRLALDRKRLAHEKLNSKHLRDKLFWAWTKRPDIREKLYPNRKPGISPETLAKIERELNLF